MGATRAPGGARWRSRWLVAVGLVAMGMLPTFAGALAGALLAGGGMVVSEVLSDAALPTMLDDAVLARAYGLIVPTSLGGIVVGSLVAGPLATLLGLPAALAALARSPWSRSALRRCSADAGSCRWRRMTRRRSSRAEVGSCALSDLGHAHSFHSVSAEHTATVWDNAAAPVLEVESGDMVELECVDASGGQITRSSGPQADMDMTRVNPVTGPVFVKGAEPGDALAVEILELRPEEWGWTAIIPDFGLLADEFPEPWLNISRVDPPTGRVDFADGVILPFEPFPGTIGVAPAQAGPHPVLPPTNAGGNLDIKHLRMGTTLLLPVGVEGALFSVGDTHAAMGDAEVCGTAVECAMTIAVRLTTVKHAHLPAPQFSVPAGQLARTEQSSYHVCTGVHEDLMEATRAATRAMVDHIVQMHGRAREEAYAIASVAVDLRIHEVVDAPNWVVGAWLPEAIFTD